MTRTVPHRRPVRVVTVVWGALLLAITVLVLVPALTPVSPDPVVVVLCLLVGTGVSLIAGGLLSLRSGTRRRPGVRDD